MPTTPADRALAEVDKAVTAVEKATEKATAAQAKADEATVLQKRAIRELNWRASHPDLPEDFDLSTYQEQRQAPFEEDSAVVDPETVEETRTALEAEDEAAAPPVDEDDDPFK